MDQHKNLASALVAAQNKIGAVGKDGNNTHGKYRYSTADQIVGICNKALSSEGLAFYCSKSLITKLEDREEFLLSTEYVLEHAASGESRKFESACGIIIRGGSMPLDKASFVARTGDLSYVLRSTLLLERADADDDVNKMDDSKFVAPVVNQSVEEASLIAKIDAAKSQDDVPALTEAVKASGLAKKPQVRAAFTAMLARVGGK